MASAIWNPTVRTGFMDVIGSWKIMAIFPPRSLRSSASGRPSSSSPRNRMEPVMVALRGSRPMTASMLTDFPEPDSPTMPSDSRSPIEKSSPRTAFTGPSGEANVTWRSSTSSTGAPMSGPDPSLLRVEGVAQPVPHEVDRQAEQEQEEARRVEEPPPGAGRRHAVGDQQAERHV